MPKQTNGYSQNATFIIAVIVAILFGYLGYWYGSVNPGGFSTLKIEDLGVDTFVNAVTSPTFPEPSALSSKTDPTTWKTYSMEKAGFKFSYPESWDVIESYGLPAGTGIAPINLRFTQAGDRAGIKEYNDIFINMVARLNAYVEPFNDLYEYRIKAMSENGIKKEDFTIDGIKGSKYSEIGGIANNPYVYIVRSDDKFFFELENQNSEGMLAKEVSKELTEQILETVKFY